ncbi:LOG family protein [Estrella lausannensis]|uniref:AMP nucleosidase n=1 Tax=Estrella lausannensis TaxID=483423 RepID=A0A0H5DQS6_9BACT|nr:LOG family protein [Estrella lausannensis]CRX37954.1 hypothetical protein ELAC_0599 [Estrella lausannensis]
MAEESNTTANIVKLSDEEAVKEIVINSIFNLWKTVNNLTRLRPSRRERYRVTIFGSARAQPESFAYAQVKQLAKSLAEMDCDIVTGGGPGLMQAANEGATEGGHSKGSQSIGIRVDLPFEQTVNPFVETGHQHETFFSRLHHFAIASDAFVIVPGGVGTTLEAMMVWQLIQVGHIRKDTPLIFLGKMWDGLLDWSRTQFLQWKLTNPEDTDIPYCVHTPEEAIALLQKDHKNWLKEQSPHTKRSNHEN